MADVNMMELSCSFCCLNACEWLFGLPEVTDRCIDDVVQVPGCVKQIPELCILFVC